MHITICKVEEEFFNFKIGFGPCQNLRSIVSSPSHNLVTKTFKICGSEDKFKYVFTILEL